MYRFRCLALLAVGVAATWLCRQSTIGFAGLEEADDLEQEGAVAERKDEWAQWGGSPARNNARKGQHVPTTWDVGEFDNHDVLVPGTSRNIRWVAALGSVTYGTPVVASGKVFIGTNNGRGRLKRYPYDVDLGCLVCFRVSDGEFLWQHSAEKLSTGRENDWEYQGLCSTPLVENDRLWLVTNRCEVICLDTEGFRDGENDGPYRDEPNEHDDESDVVWKFDMRKELGVWPHNMSSCSVTSAKNLIFVCTSNGVDESHVRVRAPKAPSFLAMDKRSGQVVWTDNSPGENILHGQWSSPAFGVLGGEPQVIFAGGDGWLRSFRADKGHDGKPELLWEFDCNPKDVQFNMVGRSTRNHFVATPVIHDGLVYIGVGEDPEHGEGEGHLWCVNPMKRGDVSGELVLNPNFNGRPVPRRRLRAAVAEQGDVVKPNPNSALVWHYTGFDRNGDGKISFEEAMHRTISTVVVQDGLLVVPDFSGLVHCLDAKTGREHWTHDLMVTVWGSPLIADSIVYVGDEEGKVTLFELSTELKIVGVMRMDQAVYSTPVAAGGLLFIASKDHLFAIVSEP